MLFDLAVGVYSHQRTGFDSPLGEYDAAVQLRRVW